jgi:hypothetical protein
MALGLPFIECFNFPTNLCMSTLFIISNALMKFNDIHNLDLLVIIALKSCHGHKVRFLTTPPPWYHFNLFIPCEFISTHHCFNGNERTT